MTVKILYITHYADMYGANKALVNMIVEIRKIHQIEPIVLCLKNGEVVRILNDLGITTVNAECYQWQGPYVRRNAYIKKMIHNFMNYFYYRKILKNIKLAKVELIHSNSSVVNIGQFLASKLGIPHIWHLREFGWEDYNLEYNVSKKRVRAQYEEADILIAISKSIKDKYYSIAPKSNIHIVYDGVKDEAVEKKHLGSEINFCCVGVLSENKNQILIIEACDILIQWGYKNFKLHLFGNGSKEYTAVLKDLVETKKLTNHVIFHGFQTDIGSQLASMHIGVMPSVKEAFGLVTIEYMFASMPVIGSNSGATQELIVSDYSGVFFDLNKEFDLASKMQYFLDNEQEIFKMGKNACSYAKENYTVSRNAKEIFQIYKNSLSSSFHCEDKKGLVQ